MWESIFVLLRDIGVFSIIVYALQRYVEKSSIKEIEKFKLQLTKENLVFQQNLNLDLEKFKTELGIESYKFSKLHDRRIIVLSSLYEKLTELQILMTELTSKLKVGGDNFEQIEKEKLFRAAEVYNDFMMFFMKNEIFIKQETCDLLTELRDKYFDALDDYEYSKLYNSDPKFAYEILSKANETIRKNTKQILLSIKDEFRKIIDVK